MSQLVQISLQRFQRTIVGLTMLGISIVPFAPGLKADVYPGPAGLDWDRGPADAKVILSNRFQFINEKAFKDEPLDTIVQYYAGDFGGLPTRQIKALYYRGSFFYLAVEVVPSAATSESFFHIEELMTKRHGSPRLITEPSNYPIKRNHALATFRAPVSVLLLSILRLKTSSQSTIYRSKPVFGNRRVCGPPRMGQKLMF